MEYKSKKIKIITHKKKIPLRYHYVVVDNDNNLKKIITHIEIDIPLQCNIAEKPRTK